MRGLRFAMTVLSFAVTLPTSTRAEVWGLTPRASLGTRYDENLQLAVNGGTDEVGAFVLGGLSAQRHGDTTKLSVDSQVDTVRYLDAHQLDRDEFFLNALGVKYFETTEWDLQS